VAKNECYFNDFNTVILTIFTHNSILFSLQYFLTVYIIHGVFYSTSDCPINFFAAKKPSISQIFGIERLERKDQPHPSLSLTKLFKIFTDYSQYVKKKTREIALVNLTPS